MTDLSGVVNEQQATIETLRRRVAELEEKNYQLKATRGALIDAFTCVEYAFAAITAENADLKRRVAELEGEKATPRQFFSYDPDDGFEEFDTAEEAKAHAETSLDLWRDSAGDGWSDESMRVCWGIICQSIRIVNQQEYDPEKHVFVSPDCAWVEERILCSEDASKEISRLEAENAELKRQVEALREDAEVGRLVKQLVEQAGEGSGVVELWKDMGVYCYSNAYSARVVAQFPSLIETLREAAKGEVE